VASNPGVAARSGSLTVAGQSIIVTQSGIDCSFTLRSPNATIPFTASSVSASVVAATGCTWSMTGSLPSWITAASATSGGGAGDVLFSVAENPDATPRSASITVAGQPFAITQAGKPCSVTLAAASVAPGEFGGAASFGFTVSAGGCSPTVLSYASWVKVDSVGGGAVNYTVEINPGLARSASIAVGERTFTINQAPSTCTYALGAYSAKFGSPGGSSAVPVTSSGGLCSSPSLLAAPVGQIIPGSLSGVAPDLSQPYNIMPFASVTPFIRNLQLVIGGQVFTVKQRSW
jgi:hypothetical protein